MPYWRKSTKHNQSGQGSQSQGFRARVTVQRPRKSHMDHISPQLIVSYASPPHSTVYIMSLNSVKCMNCHLTPWEVPRSVCSLHVWFISGQNSKCIQSVHRKFSFINHKSRCVCSITILISLKLNLISTLNPQFQLTEDNLIESLQVNAIKLVITQLFLI